MGVAHQAAWLRPRDLGADEAAVDHLRRALRAPLMLTSARTDFGSALACPGRTDHGVRQLEDALALCAPPWAKLCAPDVQDVLAATDQRQDERIDDSYDRR